ncbi:phosphotransferase enzyme family protein [Nocardia neocaledoniensis]|uniref:phosphotransferase enzyme family protein n=1 Tax=Nocardia neocaledoniensis TaxID=236511 RepID=UPI002455BA75|nr:phosphotransferase [Nocardia neocaledoniensis]
MTGSQVFGMGDEPTAAPTWPALTEDEIVRAVAATWGGPGPAEVEWRSARPLSSTVGVRLADGARLVVKRLPLRLRDQAALAEEHRFMAHLRTRGVPVPEVRAAVGPATFVYEVQRAGVGEDRYRADFSWTPYRDDADAAGAGAMLARLHLAAEGYDAPARPARPLVASLHGDGVASAFDWHLARRPALARFLADRDWRAEIPETRVDLTEVAPLWTHGDWHPTNLLWDRDEVSTVFDFGLADRTTAVFDLATAVERTAVDWVSLRDGGSAHVRDEQVRALLAGYRAVRPLDRAEQIALADLLPLVHLGYELSEIDYFLTIAGEPRNAEIAYQDWLLGHLAWFQTPEGRSLRALVRDVAAG